MKNILLILTLSCVQLSLHAQKKGQEKVDSLVKALQPVRHDTARIKTLNFLGAELQKMGKADTAIELSSTALELSKKINFPRGEADAHFFIGQAYAAKVKNTDALMNYLAAQTLYEQLKRNEELSETYYAIALVHQRTNYDESIKFLKKGLAVAQQTNNKNLAGKNAYMTAVVLLRKPDYEQAPQYRDLAIKYYTEAGNETGLANCYVVSARINNHNGNIQQSLKDNYSALRLFEKNDVKLGIYNVYTGLGLMYENQKNWKESLNSYMAAKKAADELGSKAVQTGACNNLGNAYRELGNIEEAHKAFAEALRLSQQTGDKKGIGTAMGNLGTIYSLMGNQTEALKSYEEARKRFEDIGANESVAISYLESGSIYFDLKKFNESRQSLEKALDISLPISYKEIISKSYRLLSQIDTATGNYNSALQNYELYITYRDSLSNAETARQLSEQKMQYEFSKKEDSMKLQQALIAEQLEKQTLLSRQQQQELKLKQASLEITQREKDLQMLKFLQTKTALQLTNEQTEKKLALAEQQKALQQSQLERQALIAKQNEQELLLKDRKLIIQKAQRNIWLAGAMAFLVLSSIMFRYYRQKQKANQLLQKHNIELEEQRDHVRKAMTELQQAQLQLIQKEKMASLGELTAGIAHEIQNPLNFVNNFSEVNTDLGNELKEAMQKSGLTSEQQLNLLLITDEIIQNQQKITHHGRRAETIIRNMLHHLRKSDGTKEPTDINALVHECIDLSYHGFRNKHMAFETKIDTDFDNAVERINVMPQELSSVLLNLFNNAFYAVNEKKKQLNGSFDPVITVRTKKQGKSIAITVKDNGTGMPEKVTSKVFQPFFTTKPAGEGTGLGLSLSYDVVTKGHGGEMKVESKEGQGALFTIQLPV